MLIKNNIEENTKKRLSDSVMDQLIHMISTMNPGDRIPSETALAEQFSVGRSTIRECLKVLSYRKIIVRLNEGSFVAKNAPDFLVDSLELILDLKTGNINELVELREYLESIVVRLAARRATEEDILQLERNNWHFSEPGIDALERQKRDLEFHNQLSKCANNTILAELLNSVRMTIIKSLEKDPAPAIMVDKGNTYHKKIIEAIKKHEENEAMQMMEAYLMEADYTS